MTDLTYLINPSERKILRDAGDRPPLGLLYIAKELERHKHPARVFDLNHTSENDLLQSITSESPTLIGVSCLSSPMVKESRKLLGKLRNHSNARLIVGGYHPSILPEDFKAFADNVVAGEGEYAVECLVDEVMSNDFIVYNGETNLDVLGKPARHLLDMDNYNMQMDGMRTATMLTSRGCPNNCVFCGNMNHKVRYHQLEDIADELGEIKEFGYDAVYILDDVFTINKERVNKIGKMMKDRNLKFRATTRANYINDDVVDSLAKNGAHMVSLGIESGNDKILKGIGKNQTKQQINRAVASLSLRDIKVKGFFILGLPGETLDSAYETIVYAEHLRGLGLTSADFYPMIPYPGTKIWKRPQDYGIRILNRDYSNYLQAERKGVHIPCETEDLTRMEIFLLIEEARRRWSDTK